MARIDKTPQPIDEIDLFSLIGLTVPESEKGSYYQEISSILLQKFLLDEIVFFADATTLQRMSLALTENQDINALVATLHEVDPTFVTRFSEYVNENKKKLVANYFELLIATLEDRFPGHFLDRKAKYQQALSLAQNDDWEGLQAFLEQKND